MLVVCIIKMFSKNNTNSFVLYIIFEFSIMFLKVFSVIAYGPFNAWLSNFLRKTATDGGYYFRIVYIIQWMLKTCHPASFWNIEKNLNSSQDIKSTRRQWEDIINIIECTVAIDSIKYLGIEMNMSQEMPSWRFVVYGASPITNYDLPQTSLFNISGHSLWCSTTAKAL